MANLFGSKRRYECPHCSSKWYDALTHPKELIRRFSCKKCGKDFWSYVNKVFKTEYDADAEQLRIRKKIKEL